jgi:hypothetical protein
VFLSAYAMWPRSAEGPTAADGDVAHVSWVRRVEAAVGPAAVGLYVNEVMLDRPGQLERCYGLETLMWLREVKARTDPANLLPPLPTVPSP